MTDVTAASFEEMEPVYDGLARRARATLGVTGARGSKRSMARHARYRIATNVCLRML